MDNDGIFVH